MVWVCAALQGIRPSHAENGRIFLEMSSHYRQVSRYNTRSSFLLVSADKIGGREIIALIDRGTGCALPGYGIFVRGGIAAVLGAGGQGTVRYPVS